MNISERGTKEQPGIDTKVQSRMGENVIQLEANTPVSMNLWGFIHDICKRMDKSI